MKAVSLNSLIIACIFVFVLQSCQKEENLTERITEDELPVELKSAQMNSFMVISKSESLPRGLEKKLSDFGEIERSIPEIGVVVLKLSEENQEKITRLEEIEAIVPNFVINWQEPQVFSDEEIMPIVSDDEPYLADQWGLDAIDAPEAWEAGYKGENVKVFILDDGIDADHPDLIYNINKSLSTSFVPDEDYDIEDGYNFNHGTHVAGIIAAARNKIGTIGVAPEADIIAVKVLSEYDGSGAMSWVNEGIVYAANHQADVINLSLGAKFEKRGAILDESGNVVTEVPANQIRYLIQVQQRAIDYATKKGAIVITSAGNGAARADGNRSLISIPAELNNVVAVSATAPDYLYYDKMSGIEYPNLDIPASYTDFGISLVDVAAPGGDFDYFDQTNWYNDMILSTINGGWGWASGTSMASAHVSGVAALIIGKNGGRMSPRAVKKQLLKTADKIDGKGSSSFFGRGRVNAFRAVSE